MLRSRMQRLILVPACAGLLGLAGGAVARDVVTPLEPHPPVHQGTAAPSASTVEPMDPVMQAILLAMAARALREAAASPNPLDALGRTLERSLASAAADPRTLQTIEALTASALKDAPPELRKALFEFIAGTLAHARRERESARPWR